MSPSISPRWRTTVLRLVILVGSLATWEFLPTTRLSSHAWADPALISSPSRILESWIQYAQSGFLARDTGATLAAAIGGLMLGGVLGICCGVLLSLSRTASEVADPFLAAFNALPRPALAPLLLLWFGFGVVPRVLLSASLVFFVMLYNTSAGIQSIDVSLRRTIDLLGASPIQRVRLLIVPSIGAWVMAGLPNAVSYSMIGAILGELIVSTEGLGHRLALAAGLFDTDRLFAVLLWLMVLGAVMVLPLNRFERRLLRWRPDP